MYVYQGKTQSVPCTYSRSKLWASNAKSVRKTRQEGAAASTVGQIMVPLNFNIKNTRSAKIIQRNIKYR